MGAPEALVIGVVALLVFGPKGLAEIAKQLGQTLRAFQPTIRELQEVSREFKETLEDEIGLDEIRNPPVPTPKPRQAEAPPAVDASAAAEPTAAAAEQPAAAAPAAEEVTEEMKRAAAEAAWGTAPRVPEPEPTLAAPEEAAAATEAAAVTEAAAATEATPAAVPAELSSEDAAPQTEEKKEA